MQNIIIKYALCVLNKPNKYYIFAEINSRKIYFLLNVTFHLSMKIKAIPISICMLLPILIFGQNRKNSRMYICNICNNLEYTYYCLEEKGADTTCYVTEMFIVSFDYKKNLLKECEDALELIIENPSTIIYNLPFEKMKTIEKLTFIGKEAFNDAVEYLPNNIFEMKSLRIIELRDMRFPQEQLNRLSIKYPSVEFYGSIKPYEKEFDKSLSPEMKRKFLRATY